MAVAKVEAQRRRDGQVRAYTLTARPTQIDLGGPVVSTWAYGDTVPGPTIRANPGDELRIQVNNALPADTSVHWHGLAIQNDMDGVPPITQPAIAAGSAMLYHYVVPYAGTYWITRTSACNSTEACTVRFLSMTRATPVLMMSSS